MSARGEIPLLLSLLDEAFDRKAWHGPNLRGSLRGLTPAQAAWRPASGRHNIWELAVHAAYWKYAVWRRLTGGKRGDFPLSGSNWFTRPSPESSWRQDLALLDEQHRRLRASVAALPGTVLRRRGAGSRHSNSRMIAGVAAHDLYHAGQVRLIKVLEKARRGA